MGAAHKFASGDFVPRLFGLYFQKKMAPICIGLSSGLLNTNCFQTCLACLTTSQFNLAMQKQWCCWHTSHADHHQILLLQHAFSLCRVKTVSNSAPSLRYFAIRLHNFQCLLVHYSCHPINPNHISDILHRFASLCFEGLRWCRILDVAAGASLWDLVSTCLPGQTVEGHLVEFGKGSNGCMETWHVSLARQKKIVKILAYSFCKVMLLADFFGVETSSNVSTLAFTNFTMLIALTTFGCPWCFLARGRQIALL